MIEHPFALMGTANFGRDYRGSMIDAQTAFWLMDIAYEAGWGLETAIAYEEALPIIGAWQHSNRKLFTRIICKGGSQEDLEDCRISLGYVWKFLSHGKKLDYCHDGQSIYEPYEAKTGLIEAPISILNQSCVPLIGSHEVYARSIFSRGLAFKHEPLIRLAQQSGLTIAELCLGFVRSLCPAGIVVGIDDATQLQALVNTRRVSLAQDVLAECRKLDLRLDTRRGREILPA